jgi:hypothetical protein
MDIPVACTLSPAEMADRRSLWQSIAGDIANRRSGSDRLEIVFVPSPEVERVLPSLVDAESRCCAFASWSLRRDDEGVVLSIEAPPDGITALAQEFGFPPEIQEEEESS